MRNVILAVLASLAFHAFVAAVLFGGVALLPRPEMGVELDLSQLDLSIAEREDETAAPVASAPSAESLPRPTPAERPPEPAEHSPEPPVLDAVKFPEPEEAIHPMSTPPSVAVPAPRQAKVDAPPKPRRTIRPDYPKGARQRGEEGEVVLEIDVSAEGICAAARIVRSSGFAELDEAAVKAVRTARFVPAKAAGKAVDSSARLTVSFVLTGSEKK